MIAALTVEDGRMARHTEPGLCSYAPPTTPAGRDAGAVTVPRSRRHPPSAFAFNMRYSMHFSDHAQIRTSLSVRDTHTTESLSVETRACRHATALGLATRTTHPVLAKRSTRDRDTAATAAAAAAAAAARTSITVRFAVLAAFGRGTADAKRGAY